jgi:beta-phosphoglucomutase
LDGETLDRPDSDTSPVANDNLTMHQPAVIFDVDGVLVDSYQAHFLSWRQLFGEMGIDYSEKEFAAGFGRTSREILRDKFWDRISEEQIRQFDERKENFYRDAFRECFVAVDGAVELVNDLSADGFMLAVGSSGPTANVDLALELLGIHSRFTVKVTGADVTRGKPDPQMFQLAAERLGAPPSLCAVIEDAVHGITAANRAGMASIALIGTATREKLSQARLVVDRLSELSPRRIRELIRGEETKVAPNP